jgi:predicted alpha/beta superfamily hydrolase
MTETSGDNSVIADVEVSYLRSRHVGDEFKIFVARTSPEDPVPPPQVLVVTDAQLQYGTAVETARLYHGSEMIPPLLVVGVGYRAKYFGETLELRTRDLTPPPSVDGHGGGAPAFLTFLDEELKPFLGERYGVASAEYTLFGNSFGGLFATWALLTKPETFAGYGIGSPAYWWGDRAIVKAESQYAEAHDDLPARVFIGIGAMENPAGDLHAIKWLPEEKRPAAYAEAEADTTDMVADAALLASRLDRRHYPSLKLEHRTFASEYHLTVGGLNLSWALRSLFDTPR